MSSPEYGRVTANVLKHSGPGQGTGDRICGPCPEKKFFNQGHKIKMTLAYNFPTSKLTLKAAVACLAVLSVSACLGSSNSSGVGSTPTGGTSGGSTGGGTSGGSTGGGTSGGSTGGGTSGGSTGGGSTGGGTPTTQADFDAKNFQYIFLQATTQPLSGSANYQGKLSVLTQANANNATEAVYGDASLNVNFDPAVVKPVTGTATNFAGKVNGVDTVISGTLSTANALSNDPNMVTAQTTGVGTLTSITATLRGDLVDPASALSGSARMILNGNLKEAGGTKMSGGHQTTLTPTGQTSTIATGGSFYADKQ